MNKKERLCFLDSNALSRHPENYTLCADNFLQFSHFPSWGKALNKKKTDFKEKSLGRKPFFRNILLLAVIVENS